MAASDAAPSTLGFSTPLLCQQLWTGEYQAFPVAAPSLTSHAPTLEACLEEQRLFLEEHLSQLEPEQLSRFSFPSHLRLEQLEVRAVRADLPKRLTSSAHIELATVVVPLAAETWVFVPALEHTVYVGADQDVRETVRADVERWLAARELTAAGFLRLLPPRSVTLETLTLSLRREDASDKAWKALEAQEQRLQREQAHAVLLSVSVPLHERDEARRGPPLLGRDTELALLSNLLGGGSRQGVLLVGPERVGKTELLLAWMRAEHAAGRSRRVYATSGSRLIAGMSGLGQWQERVLRVLRAAKELDAVLFFENLGELLAQHSARFVDIPGVMKPFLEEGGVRLLGELSSASLDLLEHQQPGFLSLLARVRLEPLSLARTRDALRARVAWQQREEPSRPLLAEDALEPLVELAERYLPGGAMPGRALRLYEELRASLQQAGTGDGQAPRLTRDRLYTLFSVKTGVPEFLLREDRALFAADVEAFFRRQLVGQEEAVRRVVETLCMVKAGLQPQGKPLATFLFVGPTGVGKTELARLLATFLFGSPERLFRFDMSEFMDAWAAERLIRGDARGQGLLTRRVRQQPFCVLLLDEIEKAHPAVFDLLLQVCGEGRLTDTQGQTAWFHNALIIMTSNLGAAHRRAAMGIGAASVDDSAHYLREVHRHFRPEFVNRIDQLIAFHPLPPAQVEQVARLTVDRLGRRRGLVERGLSLEVPAPLLTSLAASGYQEAYGARALRRHLDHQLVAPLARMLSASGPEVHGGTLSLHDAPQGLTVTLSPGSPRQARQQLERVATLQKERREIDAILRLDAVERLVEQVHFLVVQLARAERPRPGRDALALGAQHHEHSRLDYLWAQVERLHAALLAAEELALMALFEQQDVQPFLADARERLAGLRQVLPSVLLALQPQRDGITLVLQEMGSTRALDVWLLPLLQDLRRRGWAAGGRLSLPPGHKGAPRRWGPEALSADALRRALLAPQRTFHEVLLSVSGPYAGAFLALEEGLHRFVPTERHEPVLLTVRPVVMAPFLSEKELALPAIAPPPRLVPHKELRLQPAVREHRADGQVLLHGGARTVSLDGEDYFQAWERLLLEHLLHLERSGHFTPEHPPAFVLDTLRESSP